MEKEILGIKDYDVMMSIKNKEEASKYLYDDELVKAMTDDCYQNGFEDGIESMKLFYETENRKKNMCHCEERRNTMEGNKKSVNWTKVSTAVGIVGGFTGLGFTIYQWICMGKDRKAMKRAAIEAQETTADSESSN